ncbi:MAG: hypothetical protein R3F30_11285 [Planctomycetota bacterium]
MKVPALRVRRLNDRPIRADGRYVLYWMLAQRRSAYNWALDRAVEHAVDLGRPLLVFEALRAGHRWSSARVHRFVLDGMAANAEAFAGSPACYMPWVEPAPGAGRGLLARLAAEACVVVTDDSTVFDLREVAARGAAAAAVRVEAVDGDGLLPLRLADRAFPTAYAFRRFLQRELPGRLDERPKQRPFAGLELPVLVAPPTLDGAWAPTDLAALGRRDDLLDGLAFAHDVPALGAAGGSAAGRARLRRFIDEGLARYGEGRNHPSEDAASGLSPWLHFGHLSVHEVLAVVAKAEDWTPAGLGGERRGARNGFWGMSASAEAFLDECVTWRELGRNNAALLDGFATYGSLPGWARHAGRAPPDRRPQLYMRRARGRRDPRPGLERGPAPAPRRRRGPQLPAHAVGQEGARVVPEPRGGLGPPRRAQQPLGDRRPRPQLVDRHRLGLRPPRPALGPRAPDLRHDPLHELREHGPQDAPGPVPRALGPAAVAVSGRRRLSDGGAEYRRRQPRGRRPPLPSSPPVPNMPRWSSSPRRRSRRTWPCCSRRS